MNSPTRNRVTRFSSRVLLAVLWSGALGCSRQAPEAALVEQVAAALGGQERILAVNALALEGSGENFNLGQNRTPSDSLPMFAVTDFKRRVDFAQSRSRLEQVRTPKYLTGNPAPVRQFLAVDGEVAFNVSGDGVLTRQPAYVARERRAELRHSPLGIMRLALEPNAKLAAARTEGAMRLLDVTTTDGIALTLVVDGTTHLPAAVRSGTYHPNLGDVTLETRFEQYALQEGLQLPSVYTTTLDGATIARIDVSRTSLNPDVADLVAPPPVAMDSGTPPAHVVVVDEVAAGIWYLTGGSHHSLVVEFADHLTLVEAPLSEARTLAVIAKARELRPGKPLTQVFPTHHHFDHSAGIRAAVAEGLVVRTHAGNRAFFDDVVARTHTIVPDALAKNPRPMTIEPFDGPLTVQDSTRTMVVYPIADSAHASPFLMFYFPKERLLYEVDAYSPPAPNATAPAAFPFAANLVQNITTLKLSVDRVVAGHGRIMTMTDLEAAAKLAAP